MRNRSFRMAAVAAVSCLCLAGTAHAQVVISQVYGGGGNSGAPYTHDFIELFNAGSTPQDLSGWSVQYASSGGTTWSNTTELPAVTLQPGQYLLIQEAVGSGGDQPLPTPDVIGAPPISMSGSKGKVALVSSTASLSGACPTDASIVDFVGYGAANCAETAPTAALSNTTAALRNGDGCTDTDDNSADFTVGAPAPRNSATPLNPCGGGSGIVLSIADASIAEGDTGTTTLDFTVSLSAPAIGDVHFAIATADGSATAGSDYVAVSVADAIIADGTQTFTFPVTINGDSDPESDETFTVEVTGVSGTDVVTTSESATGTIVNDDPLRIFHIQGDGAHSPFLNQTVSTSGEVTAIGAGGFFMQDAEGDGNPDTSDAIFVYTGYNNPAGLQVGDVATVTGKIIEFYGLTEFGNSPPATITVVPGTPTIQPIDLDLSTPSADPDQPRCQGSLTAADSVAVRNWRCLQSMRVRLVDGVVSAPNYKSYSVPLREFYAYVEGHPRPMRGPGLPFGSADIPPPGGSYDPPVWYAVPYVFGVDPSHLGGSMPAINGGAHFSADGVMGFDYGIGMFWPLSDGFAVTDPGPAYPVAADPAAASEVTIASQNVWRLFNDVNDSGSIDDCALDDPGSEDVCPTPEQFGVRLQKLSLQVREVLGAPAVVAVQEVENEATLQALADRIHADDPALDYDAFVFEGNDVGGIDVGFLVRGDVTVNGVTQLLADQTTTACSGSSPCPLHDRPPLLLDAELAGYRFAVLAIHNRSLSGIEDPSDGPRVRQKRLEQAQAIAGIAQAWQTGDSPVVPGADADVPLVVIGDFNAFGFTDGYVDVVGQIAGTAIESENMLWAPSLVDPTLILLDDLVPAELRYTFIYDGYAQQIDHALLTARAFEDFAGVSITHGNADVPAGSADADDPSTARRSTDHDGLVVRLATIDDTIFRDGFEAD